MRLDKMLSNLGYGSRTEIKKFCKQGLIIVNGKEIKKADAHVNPEEDEVFFNGKKVNYREFIYLMLNKPSGYISATFDKYDQIVLDLIDDEYLAFEPFPVGRLDKDTEGLLVLTNDGKLSHRILSPKKHVPKKYFAVINDEIDEEDIKEFEKGVYIGDYTTKPAKLEVIGDHSKNSEALEELIEMGKTEVYITISEGKFHQVKRMFESIGKKVLYLKRISMGNLSLDKNLELGEYRELSPEEILMLEEK